MRKKRKSSQGSKGPLLLFLTLSYSYLLPLYSLSLSLTLSHSHLLSLLLSLALSCSLLLSLALSCSLLLSLALSCSLLLSLALSYSLLLSLALSCSSSLLLFYSLIISSSCSLLLSYALFEQRTRAFALIRILRAFLPRGQRRAGRCIYRPWSSHDAPRTSCYADPFLTGLTQSEALACRTDLAIMSPALCRSRAHYCRWTSDAPMWYRRTEEQPEEYIPAMDVPTVNVPMEVARLARPGNPVLHNVYGEVSPRVVWTVARDLHPLCFAVIPQALGCVCSGRSCLLLTARPLRRPHV